MSDGPDYNHLRAEAMWMFVLADQRMKPEDLRRFEIFRAVPAETLQRWYREDGWSTKRSELYLQVTRGLEQRLDGQLFLARQKAVKGMAELAMTASKKLQGAPVKSFEGTMRALLDLWKTQEEFRRYARDDLVERTAEGPQHADLPLVPLGGEMSHEESTAAVRSIMEIRRRKMRELEEKRLAEEAEKAKTEGTLEVVG